jgi:AraC-like DNA-binding protein
MKLFIKHMISNRCKIVVKEILNEMDLHFILIDIGEIDIIEELTLEQLQRLKSELLESGLELIEDDKKTILIEKIKTIIIQMIYYKEEIITINFSDYLTKKLNFHYNYLANLFSEIEGITIEHFIIFHKIERVKELMNYGELTITEIAYKMNYSSVAHLSAQFKKVTGLSPTNFKQLKNLRRKSIDGIGLTK